MALSNRNSKITSTKCGLYVASVAVTLEVAWLLFLNIASFELIERMSPSLRRALDWGVIHYDIISIIPFAGDYFLMHKPSDATPSIFIEFCVVAIVGMIAFFLGMLLHSIVKRIK